MDDIEACEESIEDVREMLVVQYERERVGGRSEAKGGEGNVRAEAGLGFEKWEAEWVREVQELVKMDSGWGWEELWGCVEWGVEVSWYSIFYRRRRDANADFSTRLCLPSFGLL